jgi:hypothetical protein
MNPLKLLPLLICCALTAQAQLAVTVSPAKIAGQRVIVPLAITNHLPQSVTSVRVMCAVLDERGKLIGQTARWVVGGAQGRPKLPPTAGTTYNFVLTSPQPLTSTNLSSHIIVSRVVLDHDQIADPKRIVNMTSAAK